jgi:hypothetical protein
MTKIVSSQRSHSELKNLFAAKIWRNRFNWNLRRKQNKTISLKTKFKNVVICFFEFDYEQSRIYWKKWRHEKDFWFSIFNVWRMIVCDDHFLNDELMLKTMLRVFEKRIIRILRFRSISWIALSLSFRREARDVCVCACVCVCSCVWKKKKRIKNVVFEKNLYFAEFRDFFLLKSISELITRSLVNIKRERKILLCWQNSEVRIYICASLQITKVHFIRYTRSDFRLFYFILTFCAV